MKREDGSALLVTLLILLVMALLTSTMSVWSWNVLRQSRASIASGGAYYALESAATHALWLLANDINSFPDNRPLDEISYNNDERFVADGRSHYFRVEGCDYPFEIKILDMYSGLQPEYGNIETMFDFVEEDSLPADKLDRARAARNRLLDYIDADDAPRDGGAEREEYIKVNAPLAPRNAVADYPEEYAFIPGVLEILPADASGRMNYFTPRGFPEGKPNIFSAPRGLIYRIAEADAREQESIEEAFDNAVKYEYTLEFSFSLFDAALWKRLSEFFSLEESGYFTLLVRPMAESGRRGRAIEVTVHWERAPGQLTGSVLSLLDFRYL